VLRLLGTASEPHFVVYMHLMLGVAHQNPIYIWDDKTCLQQGRNLQYVYRHS
jgi:hypothetical protein